MIRLRLPPRRLIRVCVLVGMGGLLASCSRQEQPYRKPTYRVIGVVTVDGIPPDTPLQISCHDVQGIDAEHPTVSAALTGEGGKFEISTYESGDGVPVGEYVLTFEWKQLNLVTMNFGGPDRLNNRYRDPSKSAVRFVVEEGAKGPIDLGTIALTTK